MKDFTLISSRENPVVKQIIALQKSADNRKKAGLFVIEGLRICKDAIENNVKVSRLIVSKTALKKYNDDIKYLSDFAVFFNVVTDEIIGKISDTKSPQGIYMIVEIPKEVCKIDTKNKRYIALENVQDPSNLGAVTRTAEALGFGGIVLSGNGCDPFSPKALRASMGTLIRMPLYFTNSIIDFCKENGLKSVAMVVDKTATDIKDYSFSDNDIILIGNEANGLKEETIRDADQKVTIKMTGSAESLNAAAAAAIGMWESIR
ncbi:MAG: RNA methyltransferase [Clostridia bacterium]|nr:RNA methyltransferase [Clostridia bacterium]